MRRLSPSKARLVATACGVALCMLAAMRALGAPASTVVDSKAESGDAAKKNAPFALLSVSKLGRTLEEAPAIISVYDKDFIERFNIFTLNELLRRTPGFDQRTVSWLDTPATRGVIGAALLLLDGTPMNSHLTNLFPAGFGLDLRNYKRVEVFSGPAGVLWGAHSLLGVVNLISLDGGDVGGVEADAAVGAFGYQRFALRAGGVWRGLDAFMSLTLQRNRSPNALIEGATASTPAYGGEYTSVGDARTSNQTDWFLDSIVKLTYKDFTLFARIPVSRDYLQVSDQGGVLPYAENAFRQSDDWVGYLRYVKTIPSVGINVLAKAYVYRNVFTFDNRLWSPGVGASSTMGWFADGGLALKVGGVAEASWSFKPLSVLSNTLVGGVDYFWERVSGATVSVADSRGIYQTSEPFIDDASGRVFSVYFNDELRILDRIGISGGLRLNLSSSYASELLLTGAMVARIYGKNYVKLNIASGLRPPTMAHRFGRSPEAAPRGDYQFSDSDVPLAPEVSNSYQAELNSTLFSGSGWVDKLTLRGSFAATFVRGGRELSPSFLDSGRHYLPIVDRDMMTVEVRTDLRLRGNHWLWATYAYNRVSFGKLDLLDDIVPNSGPRHATSMGASLKVLGQLYLTFRSTVEAGVLRATVRVAPGLRTGGEVARTTRDPIVLLDFGLLSKDLFPGFDLSIMARNLLDTRYSFYGLPSVIEIERPGNAQIPQVPQAGFNVLATASYAL